MGILDRHVQNYQKSNDSSLKVVIAQTPDDYYRDPNAITWFYEGGVLNTGGGDKSHAELNFERHGDLPSGRISADKKVCAVWANNSKDIYLTEWVNAFTALYNKNLVGDDTRVTSNTFRETPTIVDILRSHFSNENQEQDNYFSIYSIRQGKFDRYCQEAVDNFTSPDTLKESGNSTTFLFIGGKMYYASGATPHFQVIKKLVPPDVFKQNSENYSSGRYSNDGKVVSLWDLLAKSDASLNHQAVEQLVSENKIKQDAVVYTYPSMEPVQLTDYLSNVTAQLSGDDAGDENPMGSGWEQEGPSTTVSNEVKHGFNNGGESIRNALSRAQDIQAQIQEAARYFKNDKFMGTITQLVDKCVEDLKQLSQIFYEGASGILSMKVSFKIAQQKRQVQIHPIAYKTRNKLGLLAYDLHALGNELLFEYNGSKNSDTNLADDARTFQWECAYAIGIINNYIKDINELYSNYSWLDYKARPQSFNFFSNEDTL